MYKMSQNLQKLAFFNEHVHQDIKILSWCLADQSYLIGEGASLALVGHPSSDGVMIKMLYGIGVLQKS